MISAFHSSDIEILKGLGFFPDVCIFSPLSNAFKWKGDVTEDMVSPAGKALP